MKTYLKYAFLHALGTALYVGGVVTLLSFGEHLFGKEEPKMVLIPIGMLLLFVCSAAITGILVFGRPVMWYLDGKKKEAIKLLMGTLGILLCITILVFVSLAIFFNQ
ncbi:hypothetical protein K9L27_02685 [Candidatus Gracilibacteria bacterium]|nr:hypothetical protein [Candidatus Gracilibacteria bacterium]